MTALGVDYTPDGELADPLSNPLLVEWMRDCGGPDAAYSWYDRLARSRRLYAKRSDRVDRRWALSSVYAFAIPTDEALALIASFGPVVEIGAGTGYWAMLLRSRGCDVLAYDELGAAWEGWFPAGTTYTEVEKGDVDKAAEHADRTLLLVWPPYASTMVLDALTAYREAGGRRLIYVGEPHGGCTGDDGFHEALDADWAETHKLTIPQWLEISDYLAVYERRA
jgi:hypothetical protein